MDAIEETPTVAELVAGVRLRTYWRSLVTMAEASGRSISVSVFGVSSEKRADLEALGAALELEVEQDQHEGTKWTKIRDGGGGELILFHGHDEPAP